MLQPLPPASPPRGQVPVEAVLFDTFGTVVDFYTPLRDAFAGFAASREATCDPGALAIEWRTAYLVCTATQAMQDKPFRPLREMHRENLLALLGTHFQDPVADRDVDRLCDTWDRLTPWPDAVEGLERIRRRCIIAPLSNGNFADMVRLSRHAALPWDIILGASVSGNYKPHPTTYLASVEALALAPEQVCMVAAHQADLSFAAGHGMQTAFVPRPLEFGGKVKPAQPVEGESYWDAAEIHPEGDWTYVADDFIDLARQLAD